MYRFHYRVDRFVILILAKVYQFLKVTNIFKSDNVSRVFKMICNY